jgi:Clostridial hydrophobic W
MPAEDTNAASSEPTTSQPRITPPPPVPEELQAMVSREPEEPFGRRHIWYAVYGSDYGWAPFVRDGQQAGWFGRGSTIEAVQIMVVGTPRIRLRAHMQNVGWEHPVWAWEGDFRTVGRPGDSKRMEALSLSVDDGEICADAFVQDIGWPGWRCARDGLDRIVTVGTTGHHIGIEAISLTVRD